MGATAITGCPAISKQVVMLQPIKPSPTTATGISAVLMFVSPIAIKA
jgi:hypothetical protein